MNRILALLILLLAAALRLPDLAARPMHGDEDVLAYKFSLLLEKGAYRYDPRNYHGPALLYLALPAAWLSGARGYADLTEVMLRLTPALCGLALVALPLLLARALGPRLALAAAALTAVSPAMVYYSRYFIPEILLVCASLAAIVCGWRYWESPRLGWALATGACLGLAYAAKETAVIAFGAMAVAAVFASRTGPWPVGLLRRVTGLLRPAGPWPVTPRWPHLAAAALASLLVCGVLSPRLLLGMPLSLGSYVLRAARDTPHLHPWYFYFQLLPGEAAIAVLAAFGLLAAWRRPDAPLLRFLAVYALALTAAYTLIPYKTPWCLLGFLHAWILLAAAGAGWLLDHAPRAAVAAVLMVATAHLGWQAWHGARRWAADPRNPYVYAHTSTDVFAIRDRLAQFDRTTTIQVISPESLWPLPWYLRPFPNLYLSYAVPENVPPAPLILATPDMEPALTRWLYELPPPGQRPLYVPFLDPGTELRPGVELRGYALSTLRRR